MDISDHYERVIWHRNKRNPWRSMMYFFAQRWEAAALIHGHESLEAKTLWLELTGVISNLSEPSFEKFNKRD